MNTKCVKDCINFNCRKNKMVEMRANVTIHSLAIGIVARSILMEMTQAVQEQLEQTHKQYQAVVYQNRQLQQDIKYWKKQYEDLKQENDIKDYFMKEAKSKIKKLEEVMKKDEIIQNLYIPSP